MNKTKFLQTDSRWGGLGYPKKPWYIRNCGCGEVSIANCIIEMDKYASYTPATIQPYCKQFAAPNGNGTYFSGIPKMMKNYGMTEVKEHGTMSELWTELAKGDRVAIYLMGSKRGGSKGVKWTSGGHFVCSVGYKYENGDRWVYMKDSYSNSSLRNGWISYKGNLKGDVVRVWSGKIITVSPTTYRPTTPYTGTLPKSTVKDGSKGDDVRAIQAFLNWCDNAGLSEDGKFGTKTLMATKVFQKTYGLKLDGIFGSECRKKAAEIVEEHSQEPKHYDGEYPGTTVKTKEKISRGGEIVAKAKEYAWPKGTASSKSAYKTGAPLAAYKTALKKYMNKTAKISLSDCGYFVTTVIRAVITSKFLALPGSYKDAFPSVPSGLSIVHKGAIGSFALQPGDVIRYKKTSSQHALIYLGSGLIAHAGRSNWFPKIVASKPWTNSNVKSSTIQVIRANPIEKEVTREYLKRGDEGENVARLQRYINWFFREKYGKDVLTADGKYGPATEGYCKLMQSDLGFKDADGLVGPKTVAAMKAYVK